MEMGLALLTRAFMPLKYWDEAFLATTYLINHTPTKLLSYSMPLQNSLVPHPIIPISVSLVALARQICGPITHISFNSDPLDASSSAIVTCTRGSSVLIHHKDTYTYTRILSLTNLCFLLPLCHPPPAFIIVLMSSSSLGIILLLI
jgi:hypothetical protein